MLPCVQDVLTLVPQSLYFHFNNSWIGSSYLYRQLLKRERKGAQSGMEASDGTGKPKGMRGRGYEGRPIT